MYSRHIACPVVGSFRCKIAVLFLREMSESVPYGGLRRKRRPRERPLFRDKDFAKDSNISKGQSSFENREKHVSMGALPAPLLKQPVILAKPDSSLKQQYQTAGPVDETFNKSPYGHARHDRPPNQGDSKHYLSKGGGAKTPLHARNSQSKSAYNQSSTSDHSGGRSAKDLVNELKPVKVIDGNLRWADCGAELLEENQTHFLVVGIIGQQGVGKSSIMSFLAGSEFLSKECVFPCHTRDNIERSSNKTIGVDMYVTEERTIFLDSQPILSPALLEQCIYNDRKLSGDYNGPAAGIEMQSLQVVSFLFTVCHVVIIMQNWFADAKLYNFLQCAEMLRLASPSNADSAHCESDADDFYPHLAFVFNRADSSLFDPVSIKAISGTISNMFAHSKLLYKGSISLLKSSLFPNLSLAMSSTEEVNLFLIPAVDSEDYEKDGNDAVSTDDNDFKSLPKYSDLPHKSDILRTFKKMILSIRHIPITHKQLTEKSWFYYAAKTWEAIKKSQMMAEFNRLLV